MFSTSVASFPPTGKRGFRFLAPLYRARRQLLAKGEWLMCTYALRCRECGKTWGNQPKSVCDDCFSPLEVSYDYDEARREFTRERIAQRPHNMWRYSGLLP